MLKQTCNLGGVQCLCCIEPDSPRIIYILYPMDILGTWSVEAAQKWATSIVVITKMNWDDDLTPWPAPGVPKGSQPFKGEAPDFLNRLEGIVGEVEKRFSLNINANVRSLVGVSLSGLFTLWQWPQCPLFGNIACLSGSFWYEGFLRWFKEQDFSSKHGMAYFLLGVKESKSRVKAFDCVGANTQEIFMSLKADGIQTRFDLVPGDHYQFPIDRLNRALAALHGATTEA